MKIKIIDAKGREYIVDHDDKESLFDLMANNLNRGVYVEYIDRIRGYKNIGMKRERIGVGGYWSDFYGKVYFPVNFHSYQRQPENLGKVYNDEVSAYKNTISILLVLRECEEKTKHWAMDSGAEIKKPVLERKFGECDAPEQIAYVKKLKKVLEKF